MIQWTTPTHTHKVMGVDMTGCDVYVSYKQGRNEVDIPAVALTYDGDGTSVTIRLTQRQTGMFKAGTVKVQINWVTPDGSRDAVKMKPIEVDENLMTREVRYVGL